jgi:secreted trypsin-like serine protease
MAKKHGTSPGGRSAERPEIIEAVRQADKAAGTDDEAFLRYLDEQMERLENPAGALRSVGPGPSSRRLHVLNPDAPAKSFHILKDPRYLKNARALALRTQGSLRVIGGQEVPAGKFLDCVAVGSDDQWGCTGTLIGKNVVVTAGHCADFATRVFFGQNVAKKGKVVRVKRRIRHPKYHTTANNDLMVLILAESVTIAPRSIATKTQIDRAPDGRVVGFGHSDPFGRSGYGVKRQVDVPVASPACQGKSDKHPDKMSYGCDPSLEIVAGRPMLAKDGCRGDSGGPFYIAGKTDDEWLLAGATSRATKSAMHTCGDGGIYVRLDKYLDWITRIPGVRL